MKIKIFSRSEIEFFVKKIKEPTLIISIRCSGDSSKPEIEGNPLVKKILFLRFDDIEEHEKFLNCVPMSDEDALKIKEVVEETKEKVTEIWVHCDAGVSRSAGVAAAIGKYLNDDDMFVFGSPRYSPNITCYRKTLNALMGDSEIDLEKIKFSDKVFSEGFKLAENEVEWKNLHFANEEELNKWISDKLSTWGTAKISGL